MLIIQAHDECYRLLQPDKQQDISKLSQIAIDNYNKYLSTNTISNTDNFTTIKYTEFDSKLLIENINKYGRIMDDLMLDPPIIKNINQNDNKLVNINFDTTANNKTFVNNKKDKLNESFWIQMRKEIVIYLIILNWNVKCV